MEPKGSLPRSKVPATCSYPEPDQSSPCSHPTSRRLNIILPSIPGSSEWSLAITFRTKILYAHILFPIRATCPTHHILLDLITQIVFGEEYGSLSSSLCSFLHSPVTSSLLGPNFSSAPYSQTPSAPVPPSM